MSYFEPIAAPKDRVMSALIAGLEIEFGRGAGEALAQRFLDAEDTDFRWDARIEERWIGTYDSTDEDEEGDGLELDRVRILGRLDGQWFVATMIVDGDGQAHGMLGNRDFESAPAARAAFEGAH